MSSRASSGIPLCVDLDGTLISGDITQEAIKSLLKQQPWLVLCFPFWILGGRPGFKRALAARVSIDPATLSYRQEVLEFLNEEHMKGRRIILATAAGKKTVAPIVKHLPFFDDLIVATEDGPNLAGDGKATELVRLFGEKGFDYAGNEYRDLRVWKHARKAIVVDAPQWVLEAAKNVCEVERIFS